MIKFIINKNIDRKSFLKYIKNFPSVVCLFFGRHFYIKSLFGCNGGEFHCIHNMGLDYIRNDIHYCIKSVLFFLIFLFIYQLKLCSSYLLIAFILIIIELIIRDRGDSILKHGIINLYSLIFLLSFGEILILISILIIKLIRIKKYLIIKIIFIIFGLVIIITYINNIDKYLCNNWNKSLNNTIIDNNNDIYSCSIEIPKKKCLIDIVSSYLDFSKYLNINCSIRKEIEKYSLKNISNLKNYTDVKRIGYPITIGDEPEIKGKQAMYSDTLLDYVSNNLINADDLNQTNNSRKKPEIFVDFNENQYGKLLININYNESLSKERNQLNSNKNSSNILFIFLDNMSRVHFYRQYKKTAKFLKNFLSYNGFSNKKNVNIKYHGFEFLKYHKFDGATLDNAIPMFSGVYYNNNNKMISILKDIKNMGYITCNVQDVCHKELMSIDDMDNYSYIEFDHEYAAPNCDPNVYHYGFGIFGGENGILRKCLYGKESFEHSLEYAKKFWTSYKNNKRFLRIVNTYGHEYSGEKAKYSDNILSEFLKDLFYSNQLENTNIFLAGDHGFALMGIYELLNPNDWKIEKSLPIFLIIIPDRKNVTYENQYLEIYKNQQNLITAFDIYYTIRHIIYGEEYKYNLPFPSNNEGESLFKFIEPKERNCSKYLKFKECQCK